VGENDAGFGLIGHYDLHSLAVPANSREGCAGFQNGANVKNSTFPAISAGALATVALKITGQGTDNCMC
jgi:hypothetical protein